MVTLAVLLGSFAFAVLLSSCYHLDTAQTAVAALVGGALVGGGSLAGDRGEPKDVTGPR